MLASDEDGASLDALRFSLASDIVELVVLTSDEAFLQTLRDAVGSARRLWHVPSPDKVSDLLVAGEVGILVLDVLALNETSSVFIGQIKRQFPDLVVVVAGNRETEISLAGLISAGIVYRFIHKPMSPGRARLFAEAAVKKYEEQRRRSAATPSGKRRSSSNRPALIGCTIGVLGIVLVAMWALHRRSEENSVPEHSAAATRASAGESTLLTRAAVALAANRLTEPAGDNALELYLQAVAQSPADVLGRAGLAEVHERLLARAENALLEERLDEAGAAIETARRSAVESGRIAFLTAQLAKSRERVKSAQAAANVRNYAKSEEDRVTPLLELTMQRMNSAHLIDPQGDNALFYLKEALQIDPHSATVQETKRSWAMHVLTEARNAVERRDFAHASAWLDAADGIATPSTLESARNLLATARRQAEADGWNQLLKSGTERLQQDRLIEPADDSAKYFLLTLRGLDPGNSGLPAAMQDLGTRLVAKARRALVLEQFDAARSWLEEASAVGFTSAESDAVHRDLDAAAAKHQFQSNIVAASDLTVVKSVQPIYPKKAELNKSQGWVELEFTVGESGEVQDIAVRATSTPGVFENAAIAALSQWRFKPVMRGGQAKAQRTRIRIRFVLGS